MNRVGHLLLPVSLALLIAACGSPTIRLQDERMRFNEAIKAAAEEQLLLNIVRLRYSDTPTNLAITSVAIQNETLRTLGLMPFFGTAGNEANGLRSFAGILPQAQIQMADRPTVTMTPIDDQEFTRRMFTPLTAEAVLYLAKTTWPVATVFRLTLENLNWVSNAQSGSGPVSRPLPDYESFRAGVEAFQVLQDRGHLVFSADERDEPAGVELPVGQVRAADLVAAAREGLEFRVDAASGHANLVRRKRVPVMRVHPDALNSDEMALASRIFRLRRGAQRYDIEIEKLDPFTYPPRGVETLDLETRSLLQILYYVAKGVVVPPEHMARGIAPATIDRSGTAFDWTRIADGLIRIESSSGARPPETSHCAVRYQDQWFHIDRRDATSMATFSLLMHLARMEFTSRAAGPTLTLPIGGR